MVDRRAARGGFLSASRPIIAVLATMDTKSNEARFIADALTRAGATPWIVDLSMKSHTLSAADLSGAQVAEAVGVSWQSLDERSRQEAAAVMVQGGTRILLERYSKGQIAGANWVAKREAKTVHAPLVAVSSFGGTAACVERVSQRLQALGYEVILFHASGVGGKSLEQLACSGELAGVVDVT